MLEKGETFGGCRIICRCGHGACGTVYLSEDAMGRRVALKVFDSPEAGERELKGIRNYMALHGDSPALVVIYHVGIENHQLYYVMEAADNAAPPPGDDTYLADTLVLRLKRQGRLPPQEAFRIVLRLLDGLEILHEAKLIHRDIKPENILFFHGEPRLGDPGMVGDFTHTLSLAGSLGFIPPELFDASAKPSPNTDLYALGKVLYCLTTGQEAGTFPSMPADLPLETLGQICLPLEQMCNRDPSRRCQNCAEFRALLQSALAQRRGWKFFLWRLRGDRRFALQCSQRAALAIIALCCLASLAFGLYRHHQHRMAQKEQNRKFYSSQLSTLRERQPLLDVQLASWQDDASWEEALQAAELALTQDDCATAERLVKDVQDQLRTLAVKHVPPRLAATALTSEAMRENGRQFGYLASPLGRWYLPKEARETLQAEANADTVTLFGAESKFRLGKPLNIVQGIPLKFRFVPPGRFQSPTTHTIQDIDYPYWILETEVSVQQFVRFVAWPPTDNSNFQLPMTGLVFNDMLVFCQNTNEYVRASLDWPPGYALRLPTEAEWEYAALGGATGILPPESPFSAEERKIQPVQTGSPNALGLYQMDGNVPEMATPYPELDIDADCAIWRGGDFQHQNRSLTARTIELRDQAVMRNCGFRVVIAPTNADYFEQLYYRGPSLHQAQVQGKTYAGFSNCQAIISSQDAISLAQTLGGHLPEPDSLTAAGEIISALRLDSRFPITTGIVFKDGSWRRLSDLATVTLPKLKPPSPDSKRLFLGMNEHLVYPTSAEACLPSLVIAWDDKEAFRNRPQLPCQQIIKVGSRRYGLLKLKCAGLAVPAILQLTRHQSPVFHDRAELEALLKAIASFEGNIHLGYQRRYHDWIAHDGSRLPWTSEIVQKRSATPLVSAYNQCLVADHGELKAGFTFTAILVELPPQ